MIRVAIQLGYGYHEIEAETAMEIWKELEKNQDFNCLYGMASMYEKGKKQQAEVAKLGRLLNKVEAETLTPEDIRDINIHFSNGDFVCEKFEIV